MRSIESDDSFKIDLAHTFRNNDKGQQINQRYGVQVCQPTLIKPVYFGVIKRFNLLTFSIESIALDVSMRNLHNSHEI